MLACICLCVVKLALFYLIVSDAFSFRVGGCIGSVSFNKNKV